MVPFVVLVVSWAILRGLGAVGVSLFAAWPADAAYALAVMLLFTASAHFSRTRADLVRMVPHWLPSPGAIITLTGVLEALGAVGPVIPATRAAAGVCLILLMLAMLPANVRAARQRVPLRGRAPTPLWLRVPLQGIFIAVTAVAVFA